MARRKKSEIKAELDIITEARTRFKRAMEWESTARSRYLEDMKFFHGDSDNGYQWPTDTRQSRDVDKRPVLTINKTRQYSLNVTNDSKQNKASIKVRPVGEKASYSGAQTMEGVIRHIEYQSDAQAVYDMASDTQVPGGIGVWRVRTDYAGPDTFDQDIFIDLIPDPLAVLIDPDAKKPDKSDMSWAFIFDNMPKDVFNEKYPEWKDQIGTSNTIGDKTDGWVNKDHIRICEYFRVKLEKSTLIAFQNPDNGEQIVTTSDKIPSKEILQALYDQPNTTTRPVVKRTVEWFKIAGDRIIEENAWLGTTIPIIRVVGEEYVIDGKYDRRGHVRMLKDPQRMYNYWSSSAVEHVALQSKTPFIGGMRAIEGFETYWNTANTANHAILTYNDVDDDGNVLAPPQRAEPPSMSSAYVQGLQIASDEMRMVTGQYQEDLGEQSNAVSGRAINARQRQGDNATYHFVDNLARGIKYTGEIVIELIPKIYDTSRIIKILGEDGKESTVQIDPQAQEEYREQQLQDENKVRVIFNPGFAKYSVMADVGPAYATRRQEAFNAFTQIMSTNPDLIKIAGDLLFKAADFPMADELADRLHKLVPPELLGKAPDPQTQQLAAQNQELQKNIGVLMQRLTEKRSEERERADQKVVNEYKAETDRLKVLLTQFDPREIAQFTAKLVLDAMQTSNAMESGNAGLMGDLGAQPANPTAQ